MDKHELIKEVAQLKEKYHCRKLDIEIKGNFTIADGDMKTENIKSVIYTDDDMLFAESSEDEDFIAKLREAVGLRQRNVFNQNLYESIAEYVNDWFGSRTTYEGLENGVHIMVEQNPKGWWESYSTNEDYEHVDDNFDADHFEAILEKVRDEMYEADRVRRETEYYLRKSA